MLTAAHADDLSSIPAALAARVAARRPGGRRRVVDLDGSTLATPGRARAEVRRVLAAWKVPDAVSADLLVIVSELVTNATVHAAKPGRIAVVVAHEWRAVRVAVIGPAAPERLTANLPGLDAENGRGLAVVDAYADRWGHRVYGTQRSMVWAVIRLPEPPLAFAARPGVS